MLQSLTVKNLALVDRVRVDFSEGLNVITGPTGAGKTLLIEALQLALGGRADFELLNDSGARGVVSSFFTLPEEKLAGIENEVVEEELQFRRVLKPTRQSEAYLNDERVRLQSLREIRSELIDFHGQHDQQAVFEKDFPRRVLDRYGDYDRYLADYREIYEQYRQVEKKLEELTAPDADYRQELELLQYQLEELEEFSPGEGEWSQIEEKRRRLEAREDIDRQLREAINILDGEESPGGQVDRLIDLVGEAAQHLEELEPWPGELENMEDRLSELRLRLREEREGLEHSAGEYEDLMNRRGKWLQLARKYNVPPEGLYSYYEKKRQRLDKLENRKENIKKLKEQREKLSPRLEEKGNKLSEQRKKTAEKLSSEVSSRLEKLNLEEAIFRVEVEEKDFGSNGADEVRWLFSSHSSQQPGPLAERISGGEISRVLLAVKSALTGADTTLTLVFDEIDTGISGEEADSVGELLAELARYQQVIVITHLPIVAAHGDRHIQLNRNDTREKVEVNAEVLTGESRLEELSRLLSGDRGSEVSRRQAEKLLNERGLKNGRSK
ncbi:MAG: DNA repair protein RecN [bacterium]